MTRRHLRVTFVALLVAAAIGIGFFFTKDYLLPKPKLDDILRSGRYSIISADDVEVRLHTPDYGALVKNLNTVVVKNVKILNNASATMPSMLSSSGYILTSEGSDFADYTALAVHAQQEDEKNMKERGLTPQSEGISYRFNTGAEVNIYDLAPGGCLRYRQHVKITNLLIK